MADRLPDTAQPLQVKVRHGPVLYDCTISFGKQQPSASASADTGKRRSSESVCPSDSDSSSHDISARRNSWQSSNVVRWQSPATAEALRHGADDARTFEVASAVGMDGITRAMSVPERAAVQLKALEQRTEAHRCEPATAVVKLARQDQGLAPGQLAVFYQQGVCVGSGVILESE